MKNYIVTICVLLTLCGCASQVSPPQSLRNQAHANATIQDGIYKTYPNKDAIPQTPDTAVTEFEEQSESTAIRASKIAEAANTIQGVERVSVVITGNTALVGIELITEQEDGKLIKIKNEVESEVKRVDTQIQNVAVTAAPDLVERITKLSGALTTDEPIQEYDDRLEDIVQQLTPPV